LPNRLKTSIKKPSQPAFPRRKAVIALQAGIDHGAAELPAVGQALVEGELDVLEYPLGFGEVDIGVDGRFHFLR